MLTSEIRRSKQTVRVSILISFSLSKQRQMKMPQSSDSESEQSAPELVEDNENRLSDDEEFPISEDEEMSEENEDEEPSKTGWADSMAKILNSDKSGVLSKAKKIEDIAKKKEKKKSYTFEIDGAAEDEDEKPDQSTLERSLAKRKYRERREAS
jgi:hypothetical protein